MSQKKGEFAIYAVGLLSGFVFNYVTGSMYMGGVVTAIVIVVGMMLR